MALEMLSIVWKSVASSTPTIFLVWSVMPIISFPPCVLAKATIVFVYFSEFEGRISLNSMFFDSPRIISSIFIEKPPQLFLHIRIR